MLTPSDSYALRRFLGYVDLLGTTYSAPSIATGYGSYIAIPLLRAAVDGRVDELTEENARSLLHECMRVLFYRDARSLDKVRLRSLPFLLYDLFRWKCELMRDATVPNRDGERRRGAHLGPYPPRHRLELRGGHSGIWRADAVGSRVLT